MKLISKSLRNQVANFPDKSNQLKFDENGVVEVSDERGEWLLKEYKGILQSTEEFLEEKKKAKEAAKEANFDVQKVQALEGKLADANAVISKLNAELENWKTVANNWKNECDILLNRIEGYKKAVAGDKELKVTTPTVDSELESQLKGKTVDELKDIAKELGVDGRSLSKKEPQEIIEVILGKANA